jgi:hypothetical protein
VFFFFVSLFFRTNDVLALGLAATDDGLRLVEKQGAQVS